MEIAEDELSELIRLLPGEPESDGVLLHYLFWVLVRAVHNLLRFHVLESDSQTVVLGVLVLSNLLTQIDQGCL